MSSKTPPANFIEASFQKLKKRLKSQGRPKLLHFLVFFLLKALCSLVMLNLYIGSQLSIVQLEESFAMMMHLDKDKVSTAGSGRRDKNVQLKANATIRETEIESNGTLNKSQSKPNAGMIIPNLADGTLQGKERLWHILQSRNVTQVDAEYWASITSWSTVVQNLYHYKSGEDMNNASPIIHGLETCQAFQNITSSNPSQRRIAPAGMFNTGTNYLSVLLEYNCQNPHRVEKFNGNAKRGHGNEWEVPWGKHSPASSRGKYFKNEHLKYTVDEVLPIVLIRNPYGWMKSMCRNSYTAKWKGSNDKKSCPQLKEKRKAKDSTSSSDEWNNVDVKFGSGSTHHQSLGHFWNDWNAVYFYNNGNSTSSRKSTDAPFPRLIIRFEDIIYFPYEVTKQICECAGGVLGHRQDDKDVANGTFHYVVRSAKAGMGHGPASQRNGLIDSWARYGSGDPKDAYSKEEVQIAEDALDPLIMETFGYR